jgi:hypothetical protein
VARGKHLTVLACGPCHFNETTGQLSGKQLLDIPGLAGKIFSSNITSDKLNGIARYTDAELAYLMRTGVARNGNLMPYMQRPNLSDQDLSAIISFLHSDDALVKPSSVIPGKTRYSIFGIIGISMSEPLPYPTKAIPMPAKDNVSTGKYLADNFSCKDCHAESILAVNITEPEKSEGYMGGGTKLKNLDGKSVLSANITFHETGLAKWTLQEFKKALKEGVRPDNSVLSFPMPVYKELSDEEVVALYEYLKTVPPIKNKVKRTPI